MANTQEEKGYMSVNSAAVYMDLSRCSIYRLMEERELPYCMVWGRRRLRKCDMDAYMNRDRTLANEEIMRLADMKLLELEMRRFRRAAR